MPLKKQCKGNITIKMSTLSEKLKELIESASNILITSHVSPDPDSICSILLLGTTLELNYPDKKINMISEELPDNLDFLPGFVKIKSQPLQQSINSIDLVIIVDAMNFGRCTRENSHELSDQVKNQQIPIAIIDHHEATGVEDNEVYINESYPAAVEQVFNTCFKDLEFKKPDGYGEITMTGLYSDTGGFTYLNGRYKETLNLIGELLDAGIKIEEIKNRLYQYSEEQMKVVAELAKNISHSADYSYTYLSDEFVSDYSGSGKLPGPMHTATKIFTDNFIRNIEERMWGFIIYKDARLGNNLYSVSLRSIGGNPDVSSIASKLDGGGHKAASGAKVSAGSVEEAIQKVQSVIAETV
jgi:phosphoesterase RecJ-like protein